MSQAPAIVIFDGECAFCDRSVKWIIAHDHRGRIRFAARQSDVGQALLARHGLPAEGVESMIVIEAGRVSTHSTGVLRIARLLPWPWKIGAMGLVVPRFIRDAAYRFFAKRRYKLAGKVQACSLPSPQQQARILTDVSQLQSA